jgi:hypothetical protein
VQEKILATKTTNDNLEMINLSDSSNKLKILLTEYKTLWSDTQSRNERQDRFLQFHITVLIAIIGGALTKPEYIWIVLLIVPLESSIFGLWFNINSLTILHTVEYLTCVVERQIREILKESNENNKNRKIEFMSWEIFHRGKRQNKFTMNGFLFYYRLDF